MSMRTRRKKLNASDVTDLFVYGTLMNDQYVVMLLNRKVDSIKATLHQFLLMTPSWSFPFIVARHGAVTPGRMLLGITKDELAILDKFEDEGNLYFRTIVVVRDEEGKRRKCQSYVGNIMALNKSVNREIKFEDRFIMYVEKRIDGILAGMPTDRPDLDRRVLHELMGSAVDNIIQSHFDGNYICNYIMIQALKDARPPSLSETLKNEELRPYARNYMELACRHIVLNQFVEAIRHEHPSAVRVSHQYYHHGIALLIAFIFFNNKSSVIDERFKEMRLDDLFDSGLGYRDYTRMAIDIADDVFDPDLVSDLILFVRENWHSTPTPLGAELEFSNLGHKVLKTTQGEDSVYDSFYWFWDFDMFHRTWRVGGHVDSHRQITLAQKRHRGFLEYAFGRYNIIGDLSRPLFDCPWAMSHLINEAVEFLDVAPHSLHVSMELTGQHKNITDVRHEESDLACLMLLGGDLRKDDDGRLREFRVFHNELDTNFQNAIHFSDRKHHFTKPGQDYDEAADVMEYKFLRLFNKRFDYEPIIHALKGYQFHTHARPINIQSSRGSELPEQTFLRKWANNPQTVSTSEMSEFIEKVEQGLLEESGVCRLDSNTQNALERVEYRLESMNRLIRKSQTATKGLPLSKFKMPPLSQY
ncbi:MAG: gamma-glutamylcyclotransferase, partial [Victivallales bacterium]|nr:gamma-glutamylcyclotransferase [Victivallales bacterium]